MTMTPKQRRFVAEYLIDGNATQAAKRAGYRARRLDQQGYELLRKPEIAAAVAEGQAKIEEQLIASATKVALELQRCGFANMADYMTVGADGLPRTDFSKLTREQAAALAEVTVDTFWDGEGKDAREVKRVKVKLVDKRGALMDLAKLRGYVAPAKLDVKHSWYDALKQLDEQGDRAR